METLSVILSNTLVKQTQNTEFFLLEVKNRKVYNKSTYDYDRNLYMKCEITEEKEWDRTIKQIESFIRGIVSLSSITTL